MKEIFRRQIQEDMYYYIKSYDSYGDGWEGRYVKVMSVSKIDKERYMQCRVYKTTRNGRNASSIFHKHPYESTYSVNHLHQIFKLSENDILMNILVENI